MKRPSALDAIYRQVLELQMKTRKRQKIERNFFDLRCPPKSVLGRGRGVGMDCTEGQHQSKTDDAAKASSDAKTAISLAAHGLLTSLSSSSKP